MKAKAFRITMGKGFHMTFANGYTVSVQFGPGNYGDNYNAPFGDGSKCAETGSDKAEVAVWGPDGNFIDGTPLNIEGGVGGYQTAEEVLQLLVWAEAQTAPATVEA